jgi:hypothetical protein
MNTGIVIAVGATVLTSIYLIHAQPAGRAEAALVAAEQTQPAQQQQPRMANMQAMHDQMMAELKAADARLDQLVADMNLATGDAKVAALAQTVTELARQQKAMHAHMAMMGMHMGPGMGHQPPAKK